MARCGFRWLGLAVGLLLLGIPLAGQSSTETRRTSTGETSADQDHFGYPLDWSSHHLLMPGPRIEDVLSAGARDPRHIYNMVMREVALKNSRLGRVDGPVNGPILDGPIGDGPIFGRPIKRTRKIKIDWSVSLENGFVPQNQFPAKYQFGVTAENCNADYAVFGLTVTTGTQANLVGINNLYTTGTSPCNSGSPWVAFAYNTATNGGQIETSPVISTNGAMVAFIESTAGASYFHVLVLPSPIPTPPSQVGTVLSPQTPTSCTAPTTVGCMTTLRIENTATNSNSSPWIDYAADTVYVGADNGILYKITPVFLGGAPALVSTGGWPVTVSTQTSKILTAPTEDVNSGRIFIGDSFGYLYGVSLTSPGGTFAAQTAVGWVGNGAGTGIIDPPIVVNDSSSPTTDQVFAFTGCSSVLGIGGAVSQVAANFTTPDTLTTSNTVDLGSGSGNGDCTGGNVHSGEFDNAFWLHGTASGHMIACGFVSGTTGTPLKPSNPKMYFFPFATNLITSTGSTSFVVNTTHGDECSPLTEFFDGTTDRVFFGVGGTTDGFLESSKITTSLAAPTCTGAPTASCVTAPSALGGTSGIIIDNQLSTGGTNIYFTPLAVGSVNGQKCNVTGGATNPHCAVKLSQSALQ
jgi:hypothetical protein